MPTTPGTAGQPGLIPHNGAAVPSSLVGPLLSGSAGGGIGGGPPGLPLAVFSTAAPPLASAAAANGDVMQLSFQSVEGGFFAIPSPNTSWQLPRGASSMTPSMPLSIGNTTTATIPTMSGAKDIPQGTASYGLGLTSESVVSVAVPGSAPAAQSAVTTMAPTSAAATTTTRRMVATAPPEPQPERRGAGAEDLYDMTDEYGVSAYAADVLRAVNDDGYGLSQGLPATSSGQVDSTAPIQQQQLAFDWAGALDESADFPGSSDFSKSTTTPHPEVLSPHQSGKMGGGVSVSATLEFAFAEPTDAAVANSEWGNTDWGGNLWGNVPPPRQVRPSHLNTPPLQESRLKLAVPHSDGTNGQMAIDLHDLQDLKIAWRPSSANGLPNQRTRGNDGSDPLERLRLGQPTQESDPLYHFVNYSDSS